eukprot:GEZU01035978.1.p1 GENE.GEZU01035978.1~~GEZU01035978.1.p1  ORF type:complete len:228 (-),score=88.01 GEZU01035978.1:482-1165(-)
MKDFAKKLKTVHQNIADDIELDAITHNQSEQLKARIGSIADADAQKQKLADKEKAFDLEFPEQLRATYAAFDGFANVTASDFGSLTFYSLDQLEIFDKPIVGDELSYPMIKQGGSNKRLRIGELWAEGNSKRRDILLDMDAQTAEGWQILMSADDFNADEQQQADDIKTYIVISTDLYGFFERFFPEDGDNGEEDDDDDDDDSDDDDDGVEYGEDDDDDDEDDEDDN